MCSFYREIKNNNNTKQNRRSSFFFFFFIAPSRLTATAREHRRLAVIITNNNNFINLFRTRTIPAISTRPTSILYISIISFAPPRQSSVFFSFFFFSNVPLRGLRMCSSSDFVRWHRRDRLRSNPFSADDDDGLSKKFTNLSFLFYFFFFFFAPLSPHPPITPYFTLPLSFRPTDCAYNNRRCGIYFITMPTDRPNYTAAASQLLTAG